MPINLSVNSRLSTHLSALRLSAHLSTHSYQLVWDLYTFVRRVCKINSQRLSTHLYGYQLECQQLGEDSYTFVCMVCKINSWRLSTHLSTHSYPLVCQLTAINSSVSSSAISSFVNSQLSILGYQLICQLKISSAANSAYQLKTNSCFWLSRSCHSSRHSWWWSSSKWRPWNRPLPWAEAM